jgi:hypothetical protein
VLANPAEYVGVPVCTCYADIRQVVVASQGQKISQSLKENELKLDESQKDLRDFQSRLEDLRSQEYQAELQYQQSLDKHGSNKGMNLARPFTFRSDMSYRWLVHNLAKIEIHTKGAQHDSSQGRKRTVAMHQTETGHPQHSDQRIETQS